MEISIPELCFVTSKVPLAFDTDGHATSLQPWQGHEGNPENVLVLSNIQSHMFGLKSVNGVSIFDTIMIPGNFKFPEIYDGTQNLSSKSILILMLNGWGDMILIQPALRAFYEKAKSAENPPQITIGCNWMHNFPYPKEPFIHDIHPNILTLQYLGAFDLLVNLIPVNHQRSRHKSIKDLCLEIMKLNGKDTKSLRPSIAPDPKKILKIQPFLEKLREKTGRKLICVNWKSRFPHKDATPSLFCEVLAKLTREYQAVLFKDAPTARIMQKEIDTFNLPVKNLSRLIQDYHDTIAALSLVDAFISVDTGIVHAAGALGVPGVALFGPFPPETHVSDYESIIPIRVPFKGKICQGPCLETHQGVGLEAFSTVTGTYAVSDTGEELGTQASGLDYYDKISDGTFNLWVYDSNGNVVGGKPNVIIIDADAGGTTLTSLSAAIDGIANITSSITGDKLQVDAASGYTFAFSGDTSNVLAALGVNTLFTGATAGGIGLNGKVGLNKNYIAAAQVYNNVGPAVAASGNTSTGTITTDGPYTGTADATYYIEITTTGTEANAVFKWSTDQTNWTENINLATDNPYTMGADGVRLTFNAGSYAIGDTFTIDVTQATDTYGSFAAGDNTNALAVADQQYAAVAIDQWTCDRTSGNTQGSVTTTIEGYYNAMAGSIGISSNSISNAREFNEAMMNKLGQIRDSISAVSLDEEMTNLIKFQHAYSAAAKLISVSDELLEVILRVR